MINIKKVDHIAIAVRNLEEAKKKFTEVYGAKFIVERVNEKGQYRVAIFRLGENVFSMLESTHPEGFVARHIERYGEGIQHLGIEVDDLDAAIEHLQTKGIKTSAYEEVPGVKREVLVGARNAFGVIIQVMEWLGEYKQATQEKRMLKVHS